MNPAIPTLLDRLLALYGSFPYHPGKWNLINRLIPFCQPTWKESRRAKRHGLIWELNLHDLIQRRIYYYGVHERWETKFIESNLGPGMVFFDVGANIGYYSLLASRLVGCEGRVYAFEPVPKIFDLLCRHIKINKRENIHPSQVALSNKKGFALMLNTRMEHNTGWSRLAVDEKEGTIEIMTTTLDSFSSESHLTRLDILKVDIEGHEGKFLEGAMSTIKKYRPILVMETNLPGLALFSTPPELIKSILQSIDYTLCAISRNGLVPLKTLSSEKTCFNIICLPSKHTVRMGWHVISHRNQLLD